MDSFTKSTNENIQNPEVLSASMHDIPLSTEEHDDQTVGAIEKIPSKSSSLRRFFKLSSIRKGSSEAMAVAKNLDADTDAGTEADVEEGNEDENKVNENNAEVSDANDQAASKAANPEIKRVRSRRFNFRFGNNAAEDAPTSSNNAPSPSKHSLRGSLSTYFNSVFKRKQSASSKHTLRSSRKKDGKAEDENENGMEMVQTTLPDQNETQEAVDQTTQKTDEVHDLNVSDENSESTAVATVPQA